MILLGIGVLTLLLAATLVGGAVFAVTGAIRHRLMFGALFIGGCALAVWCAFYVEYQPNPTLRIRGVPLPSQVLQLENGQWVPFEGPGWIINLVVVPSVVVMPVSLPLIIRGIRRRRMERSQGFPVIINRP